MLVLLRESGVDGSDRLTRPAPARDNVSENFPPAERGDAPCGVEVDYYGLTCGSAGAQSFVPGRDGQDLDWRGHVSCLQAPTVVQGKVWGRKECRSESRVYFVSLRAQVISKALLEAGGTGVSAAECGAYSEAVQAPEKPSEIRAEANRGEQEGVRCRGGGG
jgi:hypothetical protein